MKPLNNPTYKLLIAFFLAAIASPAAAFDLDSDQPITVSADSARLDDGKGIATYTGAVELVQGKTRLTAERVVLYRSAEGLNRIEANGSPARYQQPVTSGEGETDAKAKNITWSATDKQLTFERDAVIEQNGNVFRGDIIHYDTEQRVVTAEGGEDTGSGPGRVEMVIQPRGNSDSGN
ncbi:MULTISPECIES: lipopolysaccharide transport periplasmic protein LptA [unclassified Marinobacter]|uniref:lipopolysaccharide transport periplasmic protein LptA n=1 Tax=unclassified Marinobacter TaxID=83889 RepID=UPI0008DD539B|nr:MULTISPECIES: lipopolysaccharide transport periplasmic protein LptA [unclassified Marinobacter]MBQ0832162.1 lipopolysaccharide transport periplasmic protein LptA [Marinobacter sp.]OHY82271.1 lipopolysaccharide transport periplasmic protein LptA [Marinobacter sp. AC-23]